MGECGCTSGNRLYRLKAPKGYYILQMNPGCDYCDVGPSIFIYTPEEAASFLMDEIDHLPDLPFNFRCAVIKAGPDRAELMKAATETMVGAETEDGKIDDILAEILAEDLWKFKLLQPPSVVPSGEKG